MPASLFGALAERLLPSIHRSIHWGRGFTSLPSLLPLTVQSLISYHPGANFKIGSVVWEKGRRNGLTEGADPRGGDQRSASGDRRE